VEKFCEQQAIRLRFAPKAKSAPRQKPPDQDLATGVRLRLQLHLGFNGSLHKGFFVKISSAQRAVTHLKECVENFRQALFIRILLEWHFSKLVGNKKRSGN
jgi:hypothetical protein